MLKVAGEWRDGDMTILSFQDYYNARYEEELLALFMLEET